MTSTGGSTIVSGALYVVYRASQLVGIAPVAFRKKDGVWHITVAPLLCALCYLTATVVSAGAIMGLAGWAPCLTVQRGNASRVQSPTQRVVWITDAAIVTLTGAFAAYRAPRRLTSTISYLRKIQKLKVQPPAQSRWLAERKTIVVVILFTVFVAILLSVDYYEFLLAVYTRNKESKSAFLYVGYYSAYIMLIILEMQYVFSAMEIHRALKLLNNFIEELSQIIQFYSELPNSQKIRNNRITMVPTKYVNTIIDSLNNIKEISGIKLLYATKSKIESIKLCITMYGTISDAVRQLNANFGLEILLLLISFLLHLIITPYNLLVNLYADKETEVKGLVTQLLWCWLHFICAVAVVEPSHRTQVEVDRTSMLISGMIIETENPDILKELEKFSRHLILNKISFCPLNVCTLNRSVVASILGSVATYLVIIIQFQLSERF